MQRRDDSSLHSHSHSSMNNNIWYGADDAPGVIDVDISSSVAMLDYSYYNDNSAEYTSDGSGGKIEYVYVHDDDDIRDGISSNYRLDDEEEEEEEDNDIVAEEDFVEIENLRAGGEEEEESAPVAVVVKGEEFENTTEEEEEDRKIGRDYYTEFDDFINAVALEEEEEEEEEEEREGVRANGENMDEEERTRAKESEKEEEDKLESSQKRERIGSHDSATTTTRDVQEESEKRSQTGRAHGMEGENERRKRGGGRGGEEMKGGVFRHFNTFTKSISHDVNVRSLLTNVLLGDKWVIHFDGIPSIRFRIDFNVENFRTWKRWTATRCSDISKWLQKRRRAAAESRRRHREEYIRSVTKSPTKEKKEEGTPKKLLPIFSSRQKKDVAIKDDINSPQSGMNSIDKAPSRSTPKSWKEKEEEALFKILNARKKKETNGRNNNAAASDKTRTLPSSKMFKDKIARRATILLHICPPK